MNHVTFERKSYQTQKVGFTKKMRFTPSWVLGSNTRVGFKGRWVSLEGVFGDQTQELPHVQASTLHEGWTFVA
jgi:hypothetical protein